MNHFGKFCLCDVLNLTDTLYIPANLFFIYNDRVPHFFVA